MSDNSDDLILSISTDVATLRRSNKRLEAAMAETLQKIEQITAATGAKMDASFAKSGNNAAASMRKIGVASREVSRAGIDVTAIYARFFALVGSAKGFQSLIDSSTRMTNSLKVAGLSGGDLDATMNKLYASALRNHAPIETLTTLYSRAALQQKELGASSNQLVTFVDNVGKALRVSGTSSAEAEGSLLQLSQALGSGTVHAEEFNSILEGMPAFAQAAAKGIKQANGSVAELKNLVINGQLSSRALFDGFIAGSADLDEKLKGTQASIENAFTDLHTSLIRAAGEFNKASGAGKAAVDVIEGAVHKLNDLNFVKLAGELQKIIDKLDEMGKSYDDILKQAGSGPSFKERLDGWFNPLTGGKPIVNLGPAFSSQTIDVEQLGRERDERLKNASGDRLAELQRQLDKANSEGGPVNKRAAAEILREMDAIHEHTAKTKDEIISYKEAMKGVPDVLQGVQRVPSFKDQPSPKTITPIDVTDPKYAATAANATKLKKAYDDLLQSDKDRNDQLRLEIELVGKSGAVLDAARVKLELLQKAQKEGITGSQLDDIKAQADAYGKLAQKLAGANAIQAASDQNRSLQDDIDLAGKYGVALDTARHRLELLRDAQKNGVSGDDLEKIKAQADQYDRMADTLARIKLAQDLNEQNRLSTLSKQDQQISGTLRQYGLDDSDLNSPQAQQIRKQMVANDNREAVTSFLTDFKDGLVKNGESIGKAFGTALQNALMKQADKLWENLFNQIAGALLKTNSPAVSGAPGVAGLGTQTVGRLLSPTSLNANPASPTSQTGVAAQAWNFFASKGLQPHQIAGVLGNIKAESAFNPLAKGDNGQAFGLFQHHADRGGGSGLLASGATGQLDHAWAELQGPENATLKRLMASTDVKGATAAFAGFERPRGWSLTNPEGADNFSGRLNAANEALSKFGGTTNQATQGLGTLGTGLGQLGSTLGSGVSGAAAGSGGILGWIGKLFGGGGQFAAAQAGSLKPGLFADGGYTGPGGRNTPAGIVHAGEFVVPKHIVDKIGVPALTGMVKGYADGGLVTPRLVSAPVAPTLRPRMSTAGNDNRNPGILQVHINGANGDDHVRMLVKQGVGEGLSSYNTQQQRGGFGTLQGQYNSRKG